MHGGQLVKKFRRYDLHAGLEQLCTNAQRQHTTGQEHNEAEPEVECTYVFVISRKDPSHDALIGTMMVVVVMMFFNNCTHLVFPLPAYSLLAICVLMSFGWMASPVSLPQLFLT